MKLCLLLTLAFSALRMYSAAAVSDLEEIPCPGLRYIMSCPEFNPALCTVSCDKSLVNAHLTPGIRMLCLNTNPPMLCPSSHFDICARYCQGAARASSIPAARER